jgi:two-component system, chemotaxis family, chemotaxis protein CheY
MQSKRDRIFEVILPVNKIRQESKKMAYLHLKVKNKAAISSLAEIRQFLEHKLGKDQNHFFHFEEEKEVIMYINNMSNRSFSYFDKTIFEKFSRDDIDLETHDLDESGIRSLSAHIKRLVADNDETINLSLQRLCHEGNCMLVLDDDGMVLKTMENVLKSFGRVELEQDGERFIKLYKELAPNIVFVDIHLKNERGSDIIRKIKEDIDPYIHAIMISADGTRDTVLEVKDAGAHGFIVKPFNKDTVYKHLLRAPTFIPKKS